jgi:hypothetical protein
MKKFLIFIILLIITNFQLFSQKSRDVLYLKNGSIIYGNLLEISDNKYKIQTSDGSLFIYSTQDVDKFVREVPKFPGRRVIGTGFAIESGLLIGAQQSEFDAPFICNFILNYTLSTKNIMGVGSGVEFLGSTFTPLFFEYKRLFFDRKTTPFVFIRGGGLIHLIGDKESDNDLNPYTQNDIPFNYSGGASLGFGTGISWSREEIETNLTFGYRYAHTSYDKYSYDNRKYSFKNNYNRLEIKVGFKF